MPCHENSVAIAEDRTVSKSMLRSRLTGNYVTVSNYQGTTYKFHIPLTPARRVVIAESQRTVLAPTYSPAPSATLRGWTQTSRLVPDFLVLQ